MRFFNSSLRGAKRRGNPFVILNEVKDPGFFATLRMTEKWTATLPLVARNDGRKYS